MVEGTNIGGSAFEAHVASAARAIENGDCEVALITFGSLQRSQISRTLGGRPAIMSAQYETPRGIPTPLGGYAIAALRHMYAFGPTSEHLAKIAVATRTWAELNPAETMPSPLPIDQVLTRPMIPTPTTTSTSIPSN